MSLHTNAPLHVSAYLVVYIAHTTWILACKHTLKKQEDDINKRTSFPYWNFIMGRLGERWKLKSARRKRRFKYSVTLQTAVERP